MLLNSGQYLHLSSSSNHVSAIIAQLPNLETPKPKVNDHDIGPNRLAIRYPHNGHFAAILALTLHINFLIRSGRRNLDASTSECQIIGSDRDRPSQRPRPGKATDEVGIR